MGITLMDPTEKAYFSINFWHWHAIVEAVRRLDVIPPLKCDRLHEPFCGNGLSESDARVVADAIETCLLPSLGESDRLLLNGTRTTHPDDYMFHKGDQHLLNYSTNRKVLADFARFCRQCGGFEVC